MPAEGRSPEVPAPKISEPSLHQRLADPIHRDGPPPSLEAVIRTPKKEGADPPPAIVVDSQIIPPDQSPINKKPRTPEEVIQNMEALRAAGGLPAALTPDVLREAVIESSKGSGTKIDKKIQPVGTFEDDDDDLPEFNGSDVSSARTDNRVDQGEDVTATPLNEPPFEETERPDGFLGRVGRFLSGDRSESQRREVQDQPAIEASEDSHDSRETVSVAERGIRRSIERLSPQELEGMPSLEVAFDNICQWYKMDETERLKPEHVRKLNKDFQYFLEYTANAREDPRLVPLQVALTNKAREVFGRQGNRNIENRLEEIKYSSFDDQATVVIDAIVQQAREANPDNYREFQALEEDRRRVRSRFEDLDPNIIRELNINEANGTRQGQLGFLRQKIDNLDISDQQKQNLRGEIDKLAQEYSQHPVMIELGPVIEARSIVIQEIAAEGVKLPEKIERLEIDVPERTFDEALKLYGGEEALEETIQRLISRGIDPATAVNLNLPSQSPSADPDVERFIAQLEAKRDIEIYYQIAERVGLVDQERDNAHQDFLTAEKMIQDRIPMNPNIPTIPATEQRMSDWFSRRLAETDPQLSIDGEARRQWSLGGSIYSMKALDPNLDLRVNGLTPEKLAGFTSHYRRNVTQEMIRHLNKMGGQEKVFEGQWSVEDDVMRTRAEEVRRAEGALWRIGWSGTYEVLINSTDLGQYREAASSWINNLVKTGVIDREPGTLMQKANYFTESLIGKAVENSGRLDGAEKAKFMDKIKEIKYAFNVEIYAYCGELFNHSFNIQNLAAIYQRMNNFIEGMDHWKVAMQLREGQVYGVYLSQEDPEFEWMWRMMGPNGQLTGEYATQIKAHGMMKDRLANKRVGEIIWDRFRRRVDDSGAEVWDVGSEAREKNLDLLGYDRPRKEALKAYVPQNDELFEIADKNRLWMSDRNYQVLKQVLNGRTVAQGMQDPDIADVIFKLAFTPEEQKALELRDIKARKGEAAGVLHDEERGNILIFNREANGRFRTLDSAEKQKYNEAFASAKDAVDIYMQLISMTGDKARETGPSYIAHATNEKGELVPFLEQAVEMDKIPKWRLKRLTTYAKNMAARKIAEYNRGKPRNRQILRGSDAYKAIMGDPMNKQLIEANAVEWGHGGGHHGGHGAHSPWGVDVSHFEAEIGSAVWLTLDTAFRKGWSLELPDFEITDDKKLVFSRNKKMQFIEKADDTGQVEVKKVTLYTVENHPFAQSMEKNYTADQLDQANEIAKKETKKRAQLYLDGKLSRSEAGILAMQLLSIDPALNRIEEVGDQKELNRYIKAQIEESTLNGYDIDRAMARQFRGFVEWGYMSMMTTGLRRLQNMAEFAMTQDKNTPRARWMETMLQGYLKPVGESYALPHSFEAIKLIKRKSLTEEQAQQEALDPPELEATAAMYNLAMEIYAVWFGSDKEPGTLEKPTVSNENLTADELEENEVRPMTREEIREAFGSKGPPPGAHLEIANGITHQLQLQKKMLDALGRIKPLFDPTLNKVSRNYGADGASDLRQIETWDYDANGDVVYEINGDDGRKRVVPAGTEGALPRRKWRLDKIEADGTRASEGIGRGRHETSVVAKHYTTYAKSIVLRDEKGRLDPDGSGKPYVYNGGAKEYGDAHYWLRHLNVYLRVHDLPAADRKALPKELQKRRYITLEDFIISKWSRR